MNPKKKILLSVLLVLVALAAVVGYIFFASNTGDFKQKKYLYVRSGSKYEDLKKTLADSGIVESIQSFDRLARWFDLPENVHPGRYEIIPGTGNYKLVKMLKQGRQSPVNLVINKLRTRGDIIRKLSSQLEPDSLQWDAYFNSDSFLIKYQLDSFQMQSVFMPNTYQLYWNSSPSVIIDKIGAYYLKFWNQDRKQKAAALGLTQPQVIALASIVEEETLQNDEKPTIASVYLNRLKIGMVLGADPTVKFAVGNFGLKRVLNIHTQAVSPYNTYRVKGLPPGPICTPSESSIDAVLNPAQTSYLFFCAREDFNGHHNFAVTYSEHLANAKRYTDALNARNIH